MLLLMLLLKALLVPTELQLILHFSENSEKLLCFPSYFVLTYTLAGRIHYGMRT